MNTLSQHKSPDTLRSFFTFFQNRDRSFYYSLSLHGLIIGLLIVLGYTHHPRFLFGTAARSPQQVQIVNAMLVLPQPSLSKVITPNPPAAASQPTPPLPKASPDPKVSPPSPKALAQQPKGEIQQAVQKPKPAHSPPKQMALQKLKSLGLASIQQTAETTEKEAASQAQAAALLSLEQKYMGLIQQSIRSNWINQFDQHAQLTAVLKIKLDPQGNVLSVALANSSGNSAFDRQAILAVQKSSPLPLPPDDALAKKFMNLTLPFNNQDFQ